MKLKVNDYETKDVIRMMRKWSKKTQKEFAKTIGYSSESISRMETAKRNVYLHTFIDLAKQNGIDIYIEKHKDK